MAFTFDSLTYRSERRLRLNFSEALGAGAFQVGRYAVTSTDAAGVNPGVRGAFLVPNAPQVVELALDADLVFRGRYLVTATAVPSAAAVEVTSSLAFETPATPHKTRGGDDASTDYGAVLYGTDLVWTGLDLAEDPSGDLASISGLPNAEAALRRAILSDGLPWDEPYGAKLREFVDGSPSSMPEMIGAIQRAASADDRIERVAVTVPSARQGEALVLVTGTFIGSAAFNVQQDLKQR